jgi:hypothetical protein
MTKPGILFVLVAVKSASAAGPPTVGWSETIDRLTKFMKHLDNDSD